MGYKRDNARGRSWSPSSAGLCIHSRCASCWFRETLQQKRVACALDCKQSAIALGITVQLDQAVCAPAFPALYEPASFDLRAYGQDDIFSYGDIRLRLLSCRAVTRADSTIQNQVRAPGEDQSGTGVFSAGTSSLERCTLAHCAKSAVRLGFPNTTTGLVGLPDSAVRLEACTLRNNTYGVASELPSHQLFSDAPNSVTVSADEPTTVMPIADAPATFLAADNPNFAKLRQVRARVVRHLAASERNAVQGHPRRCNDWQTPDVAVDTMLEVVPKGTFHPSRERERVSLSSLSITRRKSHQRCRAQS